MIKSFDPIFDSNCKLLILGSCPSVASLQKGEYYGHKQNRFWRVIFKLLDEDFTADYEIKKQTLLKHGVALWDAIGLCQREGSLDSAITDVMPNDVNALIKRGNIKCIALNGGKAKQVFLQQYKQFVSKTINNDDFNKATVPQVQNLQDGKNIKNSAACENYFFNTDKKKIKLIFLPSTSPANAKMSFETLCRSWYESLKEFL